MAGFSENLQEVRIIMQNELETVSIRRDIIMPFVGITVVIACYNCENSIINCLDSLVTCNYSNTEYILVDDKSTDGTLKLIQNYAENHNNMNIKVYSNEENIGAGETRNRGIQYASKEYITFVDSDDTVNKLFFNDINRAANINESDCIIFNAVIRAGNRKKSFNMFYGGHIVEDQEILPKYALVYVKGCTWGKAYKTTIIKDNHIKFADTNRNEDLVFTKVAISYCKSIYYTGKRLYFYTENLKSLMHDPGLLDKNNAHVAFDIIKERLLNRGFEEELHSMYLIEIIYSTTMTCIRKKDVPEKNYSKVASDYLFRDKYFKGYNIKYKLIIWLFRAGLFNVVSFIV